MSYIDKISVGGTEYDVQDSNAVRANQGVEQAGKALIVGENGVVTTGDAGISDAVKISLLDLVQHVAYIDDQGQAYYDALYAALYPSDHPVLTATFEPTITINKSAMTKLSAYIQTGIGKVTVQNGVNLVYFECLPNTEYNVHKVLSARFRVGYTTVLPANNVDVYGIVADNTATSLTLYTGNDARYAVVYYYDSTNDTISENEIYNSIEITDSHTVYTDDALDTLRPYLTVKRLESAGDSGTVVTNYTLTGTLVDGESTVIVGYDGMVTSIRVTALDVYNVSTRSMDSGTLIMSSASVDTNQSNTVKYPSRIVYNRSIDNRRTFCVNRGKAPYYEYNKTAGASPYYPVPIPAGTTKIRITMAPTGQYIYMHTVQYDTSTERYGDSIVANQVTWTQLTNGVLEKEITNPGNMFMVLNSKYDSAGKSYPVEPSNMTVEFMEE